MSDFPVNYDNDVTLPVVSNNITEIGEEAINALREAVLNIETNIGLNANGSESNIASRLNIALNNDGTIKTSVLAASGLITLPVKDSDISDTAAIKESKLNLDFKTVDLYNYIRDLSSDVNTVSGWINTDGINLNPHLNGLIVRHNLNHINVDSSPLNYFYNKFEQLRDNSNAFTVLKNLNDDFVSHQRSDGVENTNTSVTTINGETFPSNYGHTASAVYIDPSRFAFLPQTNTDVQKLANYLDSSSIFLYGTRIQNLYSNGISRVSRSSSLLIDGYGSAVIPETTVTAYLLNNNLSSDPVDDILIGDDIIRFYPDNSVLTNKKFHNQFASVKVGDILRINYGGIQTSFIIKEKKYISNDINSVFIVRVNGRNLKHTINGKARIDRPLVNENKYATLSVTPVNNLFSAEPSLLVINPRSAQTLGNGFSPNHLSETNYLLYLALFTTGKLEDGYVLLPGIDVTGNLGITPGQYTLDSVVNATNKSFRALGFNYRFAAFSYNGEFGIAMTDSVDNAGFSIISGVVANNGVYSQIDSQNNFANNVIDLFSTTKKDPLGLGPNGSASASPPYQSSYGSSEMALVYTKIFLPLKRNTYYTNGAEKDTLQLDVNQIQDPLGDGYWVAQVTNVDALSNRVRTTYRINLDLSQSKLDVGSTIFIKSNNNYVNNGRFIIEDLNINCPPNEYTEIVVYDAVHAQGYSPTATLPIGTNVSIYFNSESITFNKSNSSDYVEHSSYKRLFETYVDENGFIFNHERSRYIITGSNIGVNEGITLYTDLESSKLNIVSISPKLNGYVYGSVNKITIHIDSYISSTNTFTGYLCNFDGYSITKQGPTVVGKQGSIIRLYDYSRVDYIDITFDINTPVSNITNKNIDIQLFSSLENNKQLMLLSTCQLNDVNKQLTNFKDKRQFGNISEENLSTSALNYISAGDKILHTNGVVRGFEYVLTGTNSEVMSGGVALVNGKIIQMNSETIVIPSIKELYLSSQYNIMLGLCLNDAGQYVTIAMLDNHEEFSIVNNISRSVVAFNPATGLTYSIECDTFENIVNNRKDLLILYLVYVSGTLASTIDTIDVKRYCLNSDSSSPLVYTNTDNFGNFKKASAMFAWLQYNNNKNYQIYLSNTTETITDPVLFNYNSVVTIDGRNSTTITFNSGSYPATRAIPIIGSNIIFKNIKFTNSTKFEFLPSCQNIIFENCDFSLIDNSTFELSLGYNITFTKCKFDIDIVSVTPINIIKLIECASITFEKCEFLSTSSQYSAVYLSIVECIDINIIKCKFTGNFTSAINHYNSSNITIDSNEFLWNEVVVNNDVYMSDPQVGLSTTTFISTDIVNKGRALIFSKVISEVSNINIINNKMTFNHSSVLRFGFITFLFEGLGGNLINSKINYNSFYHTNIPSADYETRSMIAFIGVNYLGLNSTKPPKIVNVDISHNYGNRDQLIIIGNSHVSGNLQYPGLSTQNVNITNNTCGVISYLISSGNTNVIKDNDKTSNLIINSNNCRLITNMEDTGVRWYNSAANYAGGAQTYTGNVIITNNLANWISVSMRGYYDSSLIISKNMLKAYKYEFLDLFGYDGGDVLSVIGQPTSETGRYAIRVGGNGVFPYTEPCIISDNIVNQGSYMNAVNAFETYYYEQGYIYSKCRANISNNILRGVTPGATDYNLIFVNGADAIITSNIIHGEDPTDTYKYVYIPTILGNVSNGLIKDNHFYNSFSGYNGDSKFISIPSNGNWKAYENVNQIAFAIVPLTDGLRYNSGLDLGNPGFPMLYNNTGIQAKFRGTASGGVSSNDDFGIGTANSNVGNTNQNLEYFGAKSDVLRIRNTTGFTLGSSMEISFQKNLKHVIPHGCKIKSISLGMRRMSGSLTSSSSFLYNSRFNLNLYQYVDGYASNSLTNLDRFADGYAQDTLLPITTTNGLTITGSELNSTSLTVEKTSSVNLSIATDTEIILSFSGHLTMSTPPVDLLVSPIIIKYTW